MLEGIHAGSHLRTTANAVTMTLDGLQSQVELLQGHTALIYS